MLRLTIDRRYCGPPNSGNGGYTCGALGRHIDGAAEVTLRRPPPLETELEIRQEGGSGKLTLYDGDQLVAVAVSSSIKIEAPPPVSFDVAQAAAAQPVVANDDHLLPTCFVCGPERREGDGMRLFAGSIPSSQELLAVPWVPTKSLPHEAGHPSEEFVWAALDCPTGYAAFASTPQSMLLGRMIVRVDALPILGEKCVVTAKVIDRTDRKLLVNAALFGDKGNCLAVAQNTWIIVAPEVQKGVA